MKAILPTRRLIPKWRQVRQTLSTHEATNPPPHSRPTANKGAVANSSDTSVDLDQFETAVSLWKEHHEPGVLGDILSYAMHASLQQRVIDIGTQAILSGAEVTATQRFIVRHLAHTNGDSRDLVLAEPGENQSKQFQPFAQPIRSLRELLRTEPANPLALLDYAQLQTAIGRNDVAEAALRTALGLSPNNRHVLRTLARFYVHAGKPDLAHALLRRHQRTPNDPWLMSSEIALADLAGTSSAFMARGRRMLIEAGKEPPPSFSELAGNIAMAELAAGNLKKARDLQRIALLDPTDNVAAQAVDNELQFGISLNAPKVELAIASSAEAKVLQSWFNGVPENVEVHALRWHNEEPFSSRPIQILTTLLAYKGETDRALNWLHAGLRSDSADRGLLINLAYVQARAGMLDQARLTILKARRQCGPEVEPFLLATEGLIAYQRGLFEVGDQLYGQAIETFDGSNKRHNNISTYCLLSQAIAALDSQHPRVAEIVARASEAMQKRQNPDAVMLAMLSASSSQSMDLPVEQERPRQRLTSQWVFDATSNTLTERKGLTAPGAKSLVLLDNSSRRKG